MRVLTAAVQELTYWATLWIRLARGLPLESEHDAHDESHYEEKDDDDRHDQCGTVLRGRRGVGRCGTCEWVRRHEVEDRRAGRIVKTLSGLRLRGGLNNICLAGLRP